MKKCALCSKLPVFHSTFAIFATFCLVTALITPAYATAPRTGGMLVFGIENNDFSGFDPIETRGMTICGAFANITIHERLFALDENGDLSPMLALSAEPSGDRKVWTVHLRKKVVFHDGTPFTADAVVHHWTRILNPQNRFRGRSALRAIRSVEKVDDHIVRFTLKHPWMPFPRVLAGTRGTVPTIPSPTAVRNGTQNREPVGTGPYMFREWLSADRFVVVRNPNYWKPGKPVVDEIVFRFMPDHQTRFAALEAGDLDMIWTDRGQTIQKAMKNPALFVHHKEANGAEIIILNTSRPPLDDVRVRRALAHAFNQSQNVKLNYHDCIPAVNHPFGREIDCGDCGYRKYDPDKARALLAEYGKPVAFECLHSNTQRGQEAGAVLRQFGKAVGMDISPRGLAFGPIFKKVLSGDYQASTWRIPSGFDMGPTMTRSFHTKSPGNWSKYGSAELDSLLSAQWTETDPLKRKQIMCQIGERINRDVPILYRGGRHHYIIARKNVKGLPPHQDGVVDISGVRLDKQQ